MNKRKVGNDCFQLNGNRSYHELSPQRFFTGVIMVCKMTSYQAESYTGMMSSDVLAFIYWLFFGNNLDDIDLEISLKGSLLDVSIQEEAGGQFTCDICDTRHSKKINLK